MLNFRNNLAFFCSHYFCCISTHILANKVYFPKLITIAKIIKTKKWVAAFSHIYVPLFLPCSAKDKSVLLPPPGEFLRYLYHLSALTY